MKTIYITAVLTSAALVGSSPALADSNPSACQGQIVSGIASTLPQGSFAQWAEEVHGSSPSEVIKRLANCRR